MVTLYHYQPVLSRPLDLTTVVFATGSSHRPDHLCLGLGRELVVGILGVHTAGVLLTFAWNVDTSDNLQILDHPDGPCASTVSVFWGAIQ